MTYDFPMKNILIIDGHPDDQSLCASMALSYQTGAQKAGFTTQLVKLRELDFNKIYLDNIERYGQNAVQLAVF